MKLKLRSSQFTPHADDAHSVKLLGEIGVRFGLTPRGRVWSVFAIRSFQDSHVELLHGLPNLIEFNILQFVGDVSRFTDSGFRRLCRHSSLQAVMICNNPAITDRAAETVGSSRQLRWVKLPRCAITDDGIAMISKAKQLLGLGLIANHVTDACLPWLLSLTNLRTLNVEGTGISATGIASLQTALSRCKVISDLTS